MPELHERHERHEDGPAISVSHGQVIETIRSVSLQADQLSRLSKITDVEDRRLALLAILDNVVQLAAHRTRVGKAGVKIVDPDCHAVIKAVEVAAKLLGCERAPTLPVGNGVAIAAAFAYQQDQQS